MRCQPTIRSGSSTTCPEGFDPELLCRWGDTEQKDFGTPGWLADMRPGVGVHVLLSTLDVSAKRWSGTGYPKQRSQQQGQLKQGFPNYPKPSPAGRVSLQKRIYSRPIRSPEFARTRETREKAKTDTLKNVNASAWRQLFPAPGLALFRALSRKPLARPVPDAIFQDCGDHPMLHVSGTRWGRDG